MITISNVYFWMVSRTVLVPSWGGADWRFRPTNLQFHCNSLPRNRSWVNPMMSRGAYGPGPIASTLMGLVQINLPSLMINGRVIGEATGGSPVFEPWNHQPLPPPARAWITSPCMSSRRGSSRAVLHQLLEAEPSCCNTHWVKVAPASSTHGTSPNLAGPL